MSEDSLQEIHELVNKYKHFYYANKEASSLEYWETILVNLYEDTKVNPPKIMIFVNNIPMTVQMFKNLIKDTEDLTSKIEKVRNEFLEAYKNYHGTYYPYSVSYGKGKKIGTIQLDGIFYSVENVIENTAKLKEATNKFLKMDSLTVGNPDLSEVSSLRFVTSHFNIAYLNVKEEEKLLDFLLRRKDKRCSSVGDTKQK